MRQFAISCSVGLAVSFLVTLLVLPAVLALAPAPRAFAVEWIPFSADCATASSSSTIATAAPWP
jgi:predicted RND superfamily exporter protein